MLRFLVVYLLLSPVLSMVAPFEYETVSDQVGDSERLMSFCVYNGNYGWVRFSMTIVNLWDEMVFEEHTWGYFNAEVYDLDGGYLGDVRPGDDEGYLMFLAPGGVHNRTWMWDKRLYLNGSRVKLEEGVYEIVGVYRGPGRVLRTNVLSFSFGSGGWYRPDMFVEDTGGLSRVDEERIQGISFGLMRASVGVLVAGFFEDRVLVYLRGRMGWGLEWGRNRTILWMVTVVLCILLLGLTNSAEWIYLVLIK